MIKCLIGIAQEELYRVPLDRHAASLLEDSVLECASLWRFQGGIGWRDGTLAVRITL